MSEKRSPILTAEHVTFFRGKHAVIQDVSFSIRKGEFVGIIGPNGGGKTTLLEVLLGLLTPSQGEVTWNIAHGRAHIGYVPQHSATFDPTFPATVEEIVTSGRVAMRVFLKRQKARDALAVSHALRACGITHLAHRRIGALSGGERQRAFLARALAGEPEVLVLDEPMSAVDEQHQESLYDVLRTLRAEDPITILMVSHDTEAVAREATRVLCLNKKLVSHGSYEDIHVH